jgi:hypothetical protein
MELTQAELKEILHYDPETGIFRWRYSVARRVKPWDVAGCGTKNYAHLKINNKTYKAHRLAWLYMTGSWPIDQIDHKDRNKENNKWENLRPATNKQNQENVGLSKANTSNYRGVSWISTRKKWEASLQHNKQRISLGYFKTAEEAAKAAAAKRAELFTHDTGRDQVNFARFE